MQKCNEALISWLLGLIFCYLTIICEVSTSSKTEWHQEKFSITTDAMSDEMYDTVKS